MLLSVGLSLLAVNVLGMLWYSPILFGNVWLSYAHPNVKMEDLTKSANNALIVAIVSQGTLLCLLYYVYRVLLMVTTVWEMLPVATVLSAVVITAHMPHMAYSGHKLGHIAIDNAYVTTVIFLGSTIMLAVG